MTYILAIDQGTTSTRAIIFDRTMAVVANEQQEFTQHFPHSGWVEHDPCDLWDTTLATCRLAIKNLGILPSEIAAIGISNQRETVVVWDKNTGEAIHNAIVWQDRRTAKQCSILREAGHEEMVTARTGLLIDPYFSSTKLAWILDNVDGAREKAANGALLFGTVDSFLIWKLTNGGVHATDATNAARTMLYDIHKGRWSSTICGLLDIPMEMLPVVNDCAADFGTVAAEHFGAAILICGVAGDQQAATVGQACFQPGMMKSTYGTGCFALLNTGATSVVSKNRLLTTIAYQLDGKPSYALEGSIFVAGAAVQWLRDGLNIITDAAETTDLAKNADPSQNVILVPAFVGFGAPYWNPDSRGAAFGLTRNTGAEEMAKAALESIGYQTRDLLEAMSDDWQTTGVQPTLRVDGGMSASDWTMQFLSDIIAAPVDRPKIRETTALGVAWLAGMHVDIYPDQATFAAQWACETEFVPRMDADERQEKYAAWKKAVQATMTF
ncbi:MAG: glycerol kinase GlpK [Candidatus Puniceispirillales bacterium WSBS_2018_MAG_OTU23]